MLQTFTVKKADTTTDVVYALQGNSQTSASYIDQTSNLSNPRKITVNHTLKAAGQPGSDRHQVLVQSVVTDAASGQSKVISANLTLTVPRSADVSDTHVLDALAALKGYLNLSETESKLIDGMIP